MSLYGLQTELFSYSVLIFITYSSRIMPRFSVFFEDRLCVGGEYIDRLQTTVHFSSLGLCLPLKLFCSYRLQRGEGVDGQITAFSDARIHPEPV